MRFLGKKGCPPLLLSVFCAATWTQDMDRELHGSFRTWLSSLVARYLPFRLESYLNVTSGIWLKKCARSGMQTVSK